MEKLCVFCKHFKFGQKQMGHGSTETGSWTIETGGAQCGLGHYKGTPVPENEDDLRAILLKAETCPDYGRPGAA